jgi:dihydropteroate synthase
MNDLELDWPASGDTRAISVPHPRWQERGFVKAPLADLYQRPVSRRGGRPAGVGSRLAAARALWEAAGGEAQLGGPDLRCVLPMGRLGLWSWQARPQVMGVLNVTPDSFSDGGRHASVPDAVAHARRLAAEGADILDVGGQSTRPGAAPLGAADEAARVVPVLRALAADEATRSLPLSVDTFHAEVAAAAVAAGATMVNDVSGGGADGRMLATVAALGVPYVLMHSRGTPQTMQAPENTAYTDVVAEVAAALQRRGELAVAAGIEPWRLILDPGLGFAKTAGGNLQLIAGLPRLTASMRTPLRGLPLLAGPSRKGFLGRVTGREVAEERDAASAAAAALCVANGAHIVRAHNVAAVRDAALVGDAVRRGAC